MMGKYLTLNQEQSYIDGVTAIGVYVDACVRDRERERGGKKYPFRCHT